MIIIKCLFFAAQQFKLVKSWSSQLLFKISINFIDINVKY